MEGNKDEALRCVTIAKEAIASGNKQRALKFITIARRLNADIPVDDLIAECEKIDSGAYSPSGEGKPVDQVSRERARSSPLEETNGEWAYTEENVMLIHEIKRNKDYYAILGVEKTCSVEEIRKAYKKLSLKVHPDKNKAPGSEEAFKKVCKAFKCLSDDDSRRQYDQVGLVDEFEYNQQHNVRRRRRTAHDFFEDDFDPDGIFRSFFGHTDAYRNAQMYRARGATSQQRDNVQGGLNIMVILQLLPILIIFLLAYLPFSEPDYALQKNYTYQFTKFTEKHGIEFYVKSSDFDERYPIGSASRSNIEDHVLNDYKNMLSRYCHIELQRRQWNRKYPIPHCEKLRSFGVA